MIQIIQKASETITDAYKNYWKDLRLRKEGPDVNLNKILRPGAIVSKFGALSFSVVSIKFSPL